MTEPATKVARATWTHALVGDLITTFHAGGLEAARAKMRDKHAVPTERTDAKLAELSLLVLDPDELATIDAFAKFLAAMDKPSRALALTRLRAHIKALP